MFYTVIVVFPHTQITVLAMDNHSPAGQLHSVFICTFHVIFYLYLSFLRLEAEQQKTKNNKVYWQRLPGCLGFTISERI